LHPIAVTPLSLPILKFQVPFSWIVPLALTEVKVHASPELLLVIAYDLALLGFSVAQVRFARLLF
jgi:hypothetical protein